MIGDRAMVERRIAFLRRVLNGKAPDRKPGEPLDGYLARLETMYES